MAHLRQQLRDKIQTLLAAATGRTVHVNRTRQIDPNDLPCLLIMTDNDSATYQTLSGGNERVIRLTIRVFEKAFADVDDKLDELCVQVENAMRGETGVNASDIQLDSTEISLFGEGDQPIGVATINYSVMFLNVTDPEQQI